MCLLHSDSFKSPVCENIMLWTDANIDDTLSWKIPWDFVHVASVCQTALWATDMTWSMLQYVTLPWLSRLSSTLITTSVVEVAATGAWNEVPSWDTSNDFLLFLYHLAWTLELHTDRETVEKLKTNIISAHFKNKDWTFLLKKLSCIHHSLCIIIYQNIN